MAHGPRPKRCCPSCRWAAGSARSPVSRAIAMASSPTAHAPRSTAKWSFCWRKVACRNRSIEVMVDFGYPMGPFAVGDLAGLDISAAGRRRRAAANPNYRKLPIADRLVELGRYGQKTGAGWYRYEKGDRTPHPDPEVAAIIKQITTDMDIAAAHFHRPGDPAPPAVRLGQRGLQDSGGRHRLSRQ